MKILISAGEASGDMHAASAIKQLVESRQQPVETFGMGGQQLAECGMELLVDSRDHAVMGLVEVLHKYPQLRANLNTLKKAIKERKPDVVLLVDYPHFNMKLAAEAKLLDVPVLYFIAPKVWASRSGRIQELTSLVNHMAVIFPFEVEIFQTAGIPTTYVGNPIIQNHALMSASARTPNKNLIALLPGSRKSEVKKLLPSMLEAARLLANDQPEICFRLPVAETIDESLIRDAIAPSSLNIELIGPADYNKLKQCEAAMVSSGTATLELAMLDIPMVVTYRMNALSYRVLKRWLTIEHISLVNIIAKDHIVPELLQDDATAKNIYQKMSELKANNTTRDAQRAGFATVRSALTETESENTIASLLQTLATQTGRTPDLKDTA